MMRRWWKPRPQRQKMMKSLKQKLKWNRTNVITPSPDRGSCSDFKKHCIGDCEDQSRIQKPGELWWQTAFSAIVGFSESIWISGRDGSSRNAKKNSRLGLDWTDERQPQTLRMQTGVIHALLTEPGQTCTRERAGPSRVSSVLVILSAQRVALKARRPK